MQNTKFKTWQEYFKYKGLDPKVMPDVSMLLPKYRKPQIAQYILDVIVEVENDGWVADYNNPNQYKYSLWLNVIADKKRPSGFGLSYFIFDVWHSNSYCGVRLSFEDSDTAKAVFEKFKNFYEDLYLPYYPKEKVIKKKQSK